MIGHAGEIFHLSGNLQDVLDVMRCLVYVSNVSDLVWRVHLHGFLKF